MGEVQEFLNFRRMMTPVLIQIIFWVGLLGIVVSAIMMIAGGSRFAAETGQAGGPVVGIVVLIFGPLYWRVICETLIVVFRMNENLAKIEHNTQPSPGSFTASPPPSQG